MKDIESIIMECKDYGYDHTDRLSLIYHVFASKKLSEDKSLMKKLIERNNSCMENEMIANSSCYLKKWKKILEDGVDSTINMFLERSDEGQVMRSCSPAVAIITQEERQEILCAFGLPNPNPDSHYTFHYD